MCSEQHIKLICKNFVKQSFVTLATSSILPYFKAHFITQIAEVNVPVNFISQTKCDRGAYKCCLVSFMVSFAAL